MEFNARKLKGVFEITLKPHLDERGFFMRTFDIDLFKRSGLDFNWVQENHSRSEQKGIIRGLHLQLPPYSETKLVRCIQGAILDVFVDLREDSLTLGQWDSIVLSAENKKMILIPRGFAHGFLTLTDISEVMYKVDNFYSKKLERGIKWNDNRIGVKWPVDNPILSIKDSNNMSFENFVKVHKSIKA
jgi:dTDP-4-dehydrorhamnose 3,5-epimerase